VNPQETHDAFIKVAIAWTAMALGAFTLSQAVLCATLIYTVLQIFILLYRVFRGKI